MIPNILTTVRLILVPVFAYLMMTGRLVPAAIVFILSGVTDVLDGYIARHFNMVTPFGMVYDPLVDKLMQITAVVCLVILKIMPVWLLVIVLVKEVTMIVTGAILYSKKIVVRSNWYGKMSTVVFYIGVITVMVWRNIPPIALTIIVTVMICAMIFTGVSYIVDTAKHYNEKRID